MSKTYIPVFTGGIFQDNEMVIPNMNFIFDSEEELKATNEDRPFVKFFPFAVIFSRVLELDSGLNGVPVYFGEEELYCISGEIYDSVD